MPLLSPQDLKGLLPPELEAILERGLLPQPEEILQLISRDEDSAPFLEKFATDPMLNELFNVIAVFKIPVSFETIKTIACNPQKKEALHILYVDLRKDKYNDSTPIVRQGVQHLHAIGMPFEKILSVFIDLSFKHKYSPHEAMEHLVTTLNHSDDFWFKLDQKPEFRRSIQEVLFAQDFYQGEVIEELLHRAALLWSFALVSKEKGPEISHLDHILRTLSDYFNAYKLKENPYTPERLNALCGRFIQQEKVSSQLLKREADMVASTVDILKEEAQPSSLPCSLLRNIVYERSLFLSEKAALPLAPPPSEEETEVLLAHCCALD